MKVDLKNIIKGLEFSNDNYQNNYFYDIENEDIVWISDNILSVIEEAANEEIEKTFKENVTKREEMKLAAKIMRDDGSRYILLPSKYDIDEISMMEKFLKNIKDEEIVNKLNKIIKIKNATKNFNMLCIDLNIIDKWNKFKNECYKEIAIKWCLNHDVEYME